MRLRDQCDAMAQKITNSINRVTWCSGRVYEQTFVKFVKELNLKDSGSVTEKRQNIDRST